MNNVADQIKEWAQATVPVDEDLDPTTSGGPTIDVAPVRPARPARELVLTGVMAIALVGAIAVALVARAETTTHVNTRGQSAQTDPERAVSSPPTTDPVAPQIGESIGSIEIPKIGLRETVLEGVTSDQLQRGPGHYPGSPPPGHVGNVAIAGHRTTYNQPFRDLDKLDLGDQIIVDTSSGRFVYVIDAVNIVSPTEAANLLDTKDQNGDTQARITLTTCHPKYSAKQRLVVSGLLSSLPGSPMQGAGPAALGAADGPSTSEGAAC